MSGYYSGRSSLYSKGRRLEFEPDLMARISWGRQPVRRRRPTWRLLGAALVAMGLMAGVAFWYRWTGETRAMAQMADATFALMVGPAVETEDESPAWLDVSFLSGTSPVLAESTLSSVLAGEDAELRRQVLESMRAQLDSLDQEWRHAKAIAFGGVKATTASSDEALDGVIVITGNVYFASGRRVFAVEVSAERVGNRYIPTDVWQCAPVAQRESESALDAARAHADTCFESFQLETLPQSDSDARMAFASEERVFLPL